MQNSQNPAVKRLMREARELAADPNPDFSAAPLPSDIMEWHFEVRGPAGTPFEGGLYHGRIMLPPEYPFKPPSIMLLTPSGRFEVGKKICLSISAHHPEDWQPAWGIRTMITALVAFFPTPADGALGSLSYTAAERAELARRSRAGERCARCDPPPRARGAAAGLPPTTAARSATARRPRRRPRRPRRRRQRHPRQRPHPRRRPRHPRRHRRRSPRRRPSPPHHDHRRRPRPPRAPRSSRTACCCSPSRSPSRSSR